MRILIFALSLFLLSSCRFFDGERVRGNGNVVSQQRATGSFSSVSVSGSVNVHVRQDGGTSVKIETDENLMGYIDVFVDGSTLVVREKEGYNLDPTRTLIVYVSAPVFRDIRVSGSGEIISDNAITGNEALNMEVSGSGEIRMEVSLPKVTTHISGSGTVILKGQATDLSISMSGSGDIKCFDLASDNVSIQVSGGADAEVTANKTLDVNVAGSADVRYKGNATVSQHVSGSGDIKKVG